MVLGSRTHATKGPEFLIACRGIAEDPFHVISEERLKRFGEAGRFRADDMLEGAALGIGKDRAFDLFHEILSIRQDHSASGATQCFVGCCRHDIGKFAGVLRQARRDNACNMCHVDHEKARDLGVCIMRIDNLSHPAEINREGISGIPRQKEVGILLVQSFGVIIR